MPEFDQKEEMVRTHTLLNCLARIWATFLFGVMVLLCLASWTDADETMPVTCYRDGSRIGTVTVFDWRAAAATCNMALYDCRGACMGCFQDSDYVNNVCIDTIGNVFLR